MAVLLLLVAACAVEESPSAEPITERGGGPPAFLSGSAEVPLPFDGEVIEVVGVRGYTYARVRPEGEADLHWVVGLAQDLSEGDAVRVTAFHRATEFTSRRAGRTFDDLLFASIRRSP